MKVLKTVFAALALICVSAPAVADAAAVAARAEGDNRAATLGDIKQNRAAIDAQGRELRAAIDRLSERADANLKWTIAVILAVLGLSRIIAPPLEKRERKKPGPKAGLPRRPAIPHREN